MLAREGKTKKANLVENILIRFLIAVKTDKFGRGLRRLNVTLPPLSLHSLV